MCPTPEENGSSNGTANGHKNGNGRHEGFVRVADKKSSNPYVSSQLKHEKNMPVHM
jgi:hypothetical protein